MDKKLILILAAAVIVTAALFINMDFSLTGAAIAVDIEGAEQMPLLIALIVIIAFSVLAIGGAMVIMNK